MKVNVGMPSTGKVTKHLHKHEISNANPNSDQCMSVNANQQQAVSQRLPVATGNSRSPLVSSSSDESLLFRPIPDGQDGTAPQVPLGQGRSGPLDQRGVPDGVGEGLSHAVVGSQEGQRANQRQHESSIVPALGTEGDALHAKCG